MPPFSILKSQKRVAVAGFAAVRSPHLAVWQPPERPTKRSECRNAIRPCPWISCRMHLANDDNDEGAPRVDVEMVRAIELALECDEPVPFDTCALDVAERGDHTMEEVQEAFGIWHTNAEDALRSALLKLRDHPDAAKAALELGIPVNLLVSG